MSLKSVYFKLIYTSFLGKMLSTIFSNNLHVLWLVHLQIKQMEERLRSCEAQKELKALRCKLELLEEERMECSIRCSKAEDKVKDLRFIGEDLRLGVYCRTNWSPTQY